MIRMKWGAALRLLTLLIFVLQSLTGCRANDPEAALKSAEQALIAALEARDASRALEMLHPDFIARAPEQDRNWAKGAMRLMFVRHQKISIMVLTSARRIYPETPDRAMSEGEIALVGAENLLPESLDRIQVRLGWIKMDGEWKLLKLDWTDGVGRGL